MCFLSRVGYNPSESSSPARSPTSISPLFSQLSPLLTSIFLPFSSLKKPEELGDSPDGAEQSRIASLAAFLLCGERVEWWKEGLSILGSFRLFLIRVTAQPSPHPGRANCSGPFGKAEGTLSDIKIAVFCFTPEKRVCTSEGRALNPSPKTEFSAASPGAVSVIGRKDPPGPSFLIDQMAARMPPRSSLGIAWHDLGSQEPVKGPVRPSFLPSVLLSPACWTSSLVSLGTLYSQSQVFADCKNDSSNAFCSLFIPQEQS